MKKAILAKKVGMTQIFDENGVLTPVTVLQAGPCVVTQIKTVENDGYDAIQVGFGEKKERVTTKDVSGKKVIRNPHGAGKAEVGHAKKAGTTPKTFYREFRLENTAEYELGAEIKADIFAAGDKIDVTAKSKEKDSRAQLRDMDSQEDLWLMVLNTIDMQVQTVLAQLLVEYSRARRCLDIWEM